MLPVFRNPLAVSARVRAMPDLLDRTRLASVAVLAAFAALSLAIVGHLAATGVSVPLPGLDGNGLVLTTPNQASDANSSTGSSGAASAAGSAAAGAAATGAGSGATGTGTRAGKGAGTQPGAPAANGAEPRQIGISIGSDIPAPPATPQGPGSTATPGTGTPGTGTSGTGGGPQDTSGSTPSNQSGPANNWGHSSSTPTGATGSGRASKSLTSGQSGTTLGGSTSSGTGKASGRTSTSSKTKGPAPTSTSTPDSSSLGGKVKSLVPGQLK